MKRLLRKLVRWIDVRAGTLACIGCGCTEHAACEGGCGWTTKDPAICSRCAPDLPSMVRLLERQELAA
jgi:hypothetical protein